MVAVLDEVWRPNVGIMADVFHSWCEPDLHARLRRYGDRINSVQVCDVKVHERGGFDREYPGGGRGAAPEFFATMIEIGYTGFWELEVFSGDGTYGGADYPTTRGRRGSRWSSRGVCR
jgi:sugar phosphate isomerase/epimerase